MKEGFVYIMASPSRTVYIGVTNDAERRILEPKHDTEDSFVARYGCRKLVYIEQHGDIRDAIAREKQLKGWRRERKLALIEAENPGWLDLSRDWYG